MSQITNNSIILTNSEFKNIKQIIYTKCGINITIEQKNLLEHKLRKRLKHCTLDCFTQYYNRLNSDPKELQEMINVVTTNETYFFREMKHFDFLKNTIIPNLKTNSIRCWSAAGSIGAEAYSAAMVLDDTLPSSKNYEIIHSDINSEVSKDAQKAIYNIKFSSKIPQSYLEKYCLKGYDENNGLFSISQKLKDNITFLLINLIEPVPPHKLGEFDIIFLRNIIIYFDDENKKRIVENTIQRLKQGGYLFMGHSESLHHITNNVKQIQPSIYQKI